MLLNPINASLTTYWSLVKNSGVSRLESSVSLIAVIGAICVTVCVCNGVGFTEIGKEIGKDFLFF